MTDAILMMSFVLIFFVFLTFQIAAVHRQCFMPSGGIRLACLLAIADVALLASSRSRYQEAASAMLLCCCRFCCCYCCSERAIASPCLS